MTRINLGVHPSELCDQMLVAEYRELPRMNAFALKRLEKYDGAGPRPEFPTLGTGHMAYFLPYGLWLIAHYEQILQEMEFRGFKAKNKYWSYPSIFCVRGMALSVAAQFQPAIRERINQQLKAMKRIPTWTNRSKPEWLLTDTRFKENK
jgi:hypothetical protein